MVNPKDKLVALPLGEEAGVLDFPVSCSGLDEYVAQLAMALPTPVRRAEMAAIAHWRADGYIAAGDVLEMLFALERIDPNIAINDENAKTLNPVITAQRATWRNLLTLHENKVPQAPVSVFEQDSTLSLAEWEDLRIRDTEQWIASFCNLLGYLVEAHGVDVTSFRDKLPTPVEQTLLRQQTLQLMGTPMLLGYSLYNNAGMLGGGPDTVRSLAEALAATALNSKCDLQAARERQDDGLAQTHQAHLHFWWLVLKGFVYAAAQSNGGHHYLPKALVDRPDTVGILASALTTGRQVLGEITNDDTWKLWSMGPGKRQNMLIATLGVNDLIEAFQQKIAQAAGTNTAD